MISHPKEYNLKSIITKKLLDREIKEICLLKDKEWGFGIKSQIKWFRNNVKKYDINNLLYLKSKLVGYTLLRKRTYKLKNSSKKNKYLLFDTLIIDKKYRRRRLSNLIMNFNNLIIKELGFFSFLICKDEMVKFYIKNEWKKLNNKKFSIMDYPFSSNGMIFNILKLNKKYIFYINK